MPLHVYRQPHTALHATLHHVHSPCHDASFHIRPLVSTRPLIIRRQSYSWTLPFNTLTCCPCILHCNPASAAHIASFLPPFPQARRLVNRCRALVFAARTSPLPAVRARIDSARLSDEQYLVTTYLGGF
jgi:hypothetical protein